MTSKSRVVLDTNVLVAAGFNPESASARIVQAVREGRLRLVWSEGTRRESESVVRQIPPLSWDRFGDLFREEARHAGELHPEEMDHVPDPEDRKFAALAGAANAALITNDDDLLRSRERADVTIMAPDEFLGWR